MRDEKENKELIIYVVIAYGVTFLMGLFMWYGNSKNLDLSTFPNAQMFYPAAGVMLAMLCVRKEDMLIPKAFYLFFICVTLILAVIAILSIFLPICADGCRRNTHFYLGIVTARVNYWCKRCKLDYFAGDKEGEAQSIWFVLE